MARKGRRGPRRSNAFIGLMARSSARADRATSASRRTSRSRTATSSRRSSSRRTRSGPTRPCGSPASRSARSSRSSRSRAPTPRVLVMELKDSALPLHEDATAKIRPRIFLEGNFFVDLKPGTPGSPELDVRRHDQDHPDGHAGAARRGADLAAERLARGPQGAARRAQHGAELQADGGARTRRRRWRAGRPRRESFNDALDDIPAAERSTAQVLEALLGTEPDARRRAADPRHGEHGRASSTATRASSRT